MATHSSYELCLRNRANHQKRCKDILRLLLSHIHSHKARVNAQATMPRATIKPTGPTWATEPRISARLPAALLDVVEVEVVVEEGGGKPLDVVMVLLEAVDAGLEEPEREPV
jgi:hypothetical protein